MGVYFTACASFMFHINCSNRFALRTPNFFLLAWQIIRWSCPSTSTFAVFDINCVHRFVWTLRAPNPFFLAWQIKTWSCFTAWAFLTFDINSNNRFALRAPYPFFLAWQIKICPLGFSTSTTSFCL